MSLLRRIDIEVVSDVICPWCFIGKRRLEKALALLDGELAARLSWQPFQLNPDMPREGIARADYRRAKFGSLERSRQLDQRVAGEARGEGLEFAFERMQRTPNTFAAHQLIDLAQEAGAGDAVVEALFRAYFLDARDIGDPEVLFGIGEACGLTRAVAEERWRDEAHAQRIAAEEEKFREMGISGVPTFIFNRRSAVSGAHPPETLAQAVRAAASA